jgi:ankyrin repeat protein
VRGTVWSAVLQDDYELLTALAADVNKPDPKGRCALHFAAEKPQGGNAVAVLLDLGADANALDDELSAPLHLAALAGNALGVHALLRSGADPDAKDLKERTAFFGVRPAEGGGGGD